MPGREITLQLRKISRNTLIPSSQRYSKQKKKMRMVSLWSTKKRFSSFCNWSLQTTQWKHWLTMSTLRTNHSRKIMFSLNPIRKILKRSSLNNQVSLNLKTLWTNLSLMKGWQTQILTCPEFLRATTSWTRQSTQFILEIESEKIFYFNFYILQGFWGFGAFWGFLRLLGDFWGFFLWKPSS